MTDIFLDQLARTEQVGANDFVFATGFDANNNLVSYKALVSRVRNIGYNVDQNTITGSWGVGTVSEDFSAPLNGIKTGFFFNNDGTGLYAKGSTIEENVWLSPTTENSVVSLRYINNNYDTNFPIQPNNLIDSGYGDLSVLRGEFFGLGGVRNYPVYTLGAPVPSAHYLTSDFVKSQQDVADAVLSQLPNKLSLLLNLGDSTNKAGILTTLDVDTKQNTFDSSSQHLSDEGLFSSLAGNASQVESKRLNAKSVLGLDLWDFDKPVVTRDLINTLDTLTEGYLSTGTVQRVDKELQDALNLDGLFSITNNLSEYESLGLTEQDKNSDRETVFGLGDAQLTKSSEYLEVQDYPTTLQNDVDAYYSNLISKDNFSERYTAATFVKTNLAFEKIQDIDARSGVIVGGSGDILTSASFEYFTKTCYDDYKAQVSSVVSDKALRRDLSNFTNTSTTSQDLLRASVLKNTNYQRIDQGRFLNALSTNALATKPYESLYNKDFISNTGSPVIRVPHTLFSVGGNKVAPSYNLGGSEANRLLSHNEITGATTYESGYSQNIPFVDKIVNDSSLNTLNAELANKGIGVSASGSILQSFEACVNAYFEQTWLFLLPNLNVELI